MEKNIFEGSANDMINQIAIIKHDIFDNSNDKTIDAFDLALKFFFANKKIRKEFVEEAGKRNPEIMPILKSKYDLTCKISRKCDILDVVGKPFKVISKTLDTFGKILCFLPSLGLNSGLRMLKSQNIFKAAVGGVLTAVSAPIDFAIAVPVAFVSTVIQTPDRLITKYLENEAANNIKDTANEFFKNDIAEKTKNEIGILEIKSVKNGVDEINNILDSKFKPLDEENSIIL